jgi:hypothetical protein
VHDHKRLVTGVANITINRKERYFLIYLLVEWYNFGGDLIRMGSPSIKEMG